MTNALYLVIDVVGGTYIDEFICAHDSMIFFDRHPQHHHRSNGPNERSNPASHKMISTWLYPQHKYIQRCREENNALDLKGKHVLVVGGTQGIGAGLLPQSPSSAPASICLQGADIVAVARRFAGLHCKVSVAGRSEKRGRSVLWEANLASPGPLGKFYKVDLSSMKEVERFTDEVTRDTKGKGIDYLILCAGGPPIGRWRGPTSEVPFL